MIFEKRASAPAGLITINTARSSYTINDGGTITATDLGDIAALLSSPFLQKQGSGATYVPPPVIENVFLKDGVLVRASDQTPVGAGTPGSPGPAGTPGVNWRGPWVSSNNYAKYDGVIWLGSSYVALNAISSGGTVPGLDTTNWLQVTQGGGEIARAEQTSAQTLGNATQSTWTDLTGLQIVVVAGAPTFMLEAYIPALAVIGAPTNVAGDTYNIGLHIRDENGTMVSQGHAQVQMSAASRTEMLPLMARRVMSSPTVDHTYKASIYWSASRSGVGTITIYNGPGTATGIPGLDSGPSWLTATAR